MRTAARRRCRIRTGARGGCSPATSWASCWATTWCAGTGTAASWPARSSPAAAGRGAAATLPGFKWIAREPGIVYGYEEAIGYCVQPDVVRDKDGLSAALMVAEMAAWAKAEGTTLIGRLDELAAEHGLYSTSQL